LRKEELCKIKSK